MTWLLLHLAAAFALLAFYAWVLMRVGHGGKGWPRLRRKRIPNQRSQIRRDLPDEHAVDRLHRVH
jgi:hypothetical protein